MDRGRAFSRSSTRGPRGRDFLPHATEEWERRRSRSPMRQIMPGMLQELHQARLVSHDPLADPHRTMTTSATRFFGNQDPLMLEASCRATLPTATTCCEEASSPVYRPDNREQAKQGAIQLGDQAAQSDDSTPPGADEDASHLVNKMDIGRVEGGDSSMPSSGEADPVGMQAFIPELLLHAPPSPPPRAASRAAKPRKTRESTRSSTRLAARPSSVPVAQRAQLKLMRELDFINPQVPEPDAAVTAYVDMYGGDLPEEAIKAIRAAMRRGNKKLTKALEAMEDEFDATENDDV